MRIKLRLFRLALLLIIGLTLSVHDSTAQGETVSAKGNVTVPGGSCNFDELNPAEQCHFGGSGAKISFTFQGEVIDPLIPSTPVSGTFLAYYPDTGLRTRFVPETGTALIFRNEHSLQLQGLCETRDPAGLPVPSLSGPCTIFATDQTANGAQDSINMFVEVPPGFIQACCTPASGNINIE